MGCNCIFRTRNNLRTRRLNHEELVNVYQKSYLPDEIRKGICVDELGLTGFTGLHLSGNYKYSGVVCSLELDCFPKFYGNVSEKQKTGHNPQYILKALPLVDQIRFGIPETLLSGGIVYFIPIFIIGVKNYDKTMFDNLTLLELWDYRLDCDKCLKNQNHDIFDCRDFIEQKKIVIKFLELWNHELLEIKFFTQELEINELLDCVAIYKYEGKRKVLQSYSISELKEKLRDYKEIIAPLKDSQLIEELIYKSAVELHENNQIYNLEVKNMFLKKIIQKVPEVANFPVLYEHFGRIIDRVCEKKENISKIMYNHNLNIINQEKLEEIQKKKKLG